VEPKGLEDESGWKGFLDSHSYFDSSWPKDGMGNSCGENSAEGER
jgi:hypothetical protein